MPAAHPNRDELAAYGAGRLTGERADDVERHLSQCDACCAMLEFPRIDKDPFLAVLKQAICSGIDNDLPTLVPGAKMPMDLNEEAASPIQPPFPGSSIGKEERLPERIGPYEILGVLGQGGMGIVYKVRDTRLNRIAALKLITPALEGQAELQRRFRQEAESVARLQHPQIVQVFEWGEYRSRTFCAFEFVEGFHLADWLAGRPRQSARQTAELMHQLALAIHYAHEQGVVHRDLKPANVLMTATGSPKIVDFGLARRLDGESPATLCGAILGTASYMAPEQALGDSAQIGPAADIYALGAILYEILTGRPPFQGPTILETLDQVRTAEVTPPSRIQSAVPRDLETICLKCLRKEPLRRYVSALELAADLQRLLDGEPILARRAGPPERAFKWLCRHPVWFAIGAALLLATAIVGGQGMYGYLALKDRALKLNAALLESREQTAVATKRTKELQRTVYAYSLAQMRQQTPEIAWKNLHDEQLCPVELRDFSWRYWEQQLRPTSRTRSFSTAVESLDISADESLLAAGCANGDLHLLKASTLESLSTESGHSGGVRRVAFQPRGELIASLGDDGTLLVRSRQSMERPVIRIDGASGKIRDATFSPHGQTIATAQLDGRVVLRNLHLEPTASFVAHQGGTECVAWSDDEKWLATGGRDDRVRIWSTDTWKQQSEFSGWTGTVVSLQFDTSSLRLLGGTSGGATILARLGDDEIWQLQAKPLSHRGSARAAWLDDEWILTAGFDGVSRTHRATDFAVGRTLRESTEPFSAAVVRSGAKEVVLATQAGKLLVIPEGKPQQRTKGEAHSRAVSGLRWLHHSQALVTSGYDNRVQTLVQGSARGNAFDLGRHSLLEPPEALAIAPDDAWLAWAQGSSLILQSTRNEDSRRIETDLTSISAIEFLDTTHLAVAGLEQPGLQVWNVSTGAKTAELFRDESPISAISSASAEMLLVAHADGRVHAGNWQAPESFRHWQTHGRGIVSLSVTPEANLVAMLDGQQKLSVWRLSDLVELGGSELGGTQPWPSHVACCALSPDGKSLALGQRNGQIGVWDPVMGLERLRLEPISSQPLRLGFDSKSALLAAGTVEGSVFFWATTPDDATPAHDIRSNRRDSTDESQAD